MTTLPLTNKPSLADRVSQFLRPALGIKTLTKEETLKLVANNLVDKAFDSKHEGLPILSEDLAIIGAEFSKELKKRLQQRAENHNELLRIATEYHTKEKEEALKAAESIKI